MEGQIQSTIETPVIEVSEKKSSKKGIVIGFILLLILIPLAVLGFQYFGSSSNKSEIVVNQKITPSPIPSSPVVDVSDTQIDKDVKVLNDGLTNLDSSLNSVEQGLNDQPDNLQ